MKTNRIIALALTALALFSCKKNDIEDPKEEELTFENVLKADFNHLYQQGTGEKFFYEVQCELNGVLSELAPADVKMTYATSIGVVDDIIYYGYTDFEKGETTYEQEPGRWGGSFSITDISVIKITFQRAVELVKGQSELPVPDTKLMTFRHPVGTLEHPVYIFGSGSLNYYTIVDAVTGAVGKLK